MTPDQEFLPLVLTVGLNELKVCRHPVADAGRPVILTLTLSNGVNIAVPCPAAHAEEIDRWFFRHLKQADAAAALQVIIMAAPTAAAETATAGQEALRMSRDEDDDRA